MAAASPDPIHPGDPALMELVTRCVLVFEEHGAEAVDRLLGEHPDLAATARAQFAALQAAGLLVPPAPDPASIGPYRIVRRLGAGGMGVVYLAEQEHPLRRQVALKVIRPGKDSRQVLARFAVERQALASIDHPHVARILDAGETAAGRPFLVMDYVPGETLTAYCDARRMAMRDRLELFLQVCDAVQHAHHKGILHRDLKPGNVLVTEVDGRPWPMVIDFGVAKSVAEPDANAPRSQVTRHGALLGTPEYMSPEQANGALDLDTRTDVYSLGVVLYELVTGTLPIDSQRLREHGSLDVARVLRESDPPTPSHRLTGLGDEAVVCAENRSTDVGSLRRQLRGDLDWILLRALEKDRQRRYGTPAEFAADLRRHLDHEPVLAGPPGAGYRLQKLVRRHRFVVAAVAFCLGSLLAGLVASVQFAREAAASAERAQTNERTAAEQAERARTSELAASALAEQQKAIAERLSTAQQTILDALDEMTTFGVERLAAMPQSEGLRLDLLKQVLQLHERLLQAEGDHDPRLHYTLSRTLAQYAQLQLLLGEQDPALATLDRARHELTLVPAASADRWEVRQHRAALDASTAEVHASRRDAENCQRSAAAARTAFAALLAERPDALIPATGVVSTLLLESALAKDVSGRRRLLEAATPLARRVLAASTNAPQRSKAIVAIVDLALLFTEVGDLPAAIRLADEGEQALQPDLAADRPLIQRLQFRNSLDRLAQVWLRTGRNDAAKALLERSVELLRQASTSFPLVPSLRSDFASAWNNLGVLLSRNGERAASLTIQQEVLGIQERLRIEQPNEREREEAVLTTASVLASNWLRWHRETGLLDAAVLAEPARRAAELAQSLGQAEPHARNLRLATLQALGALAFAQHLGNDGTAALATCAKAAAVAERLVAQFPEVEVVQSLAADLATIEGQIRLDQGDAAGALAVAERGWQRFLALQARSPTAAPRTRREATLLVARCRARLGDATGAGAALADLEQAGTVDDRLAVAQGCLQLAADLTEPAPRQRWLDRATANLEAAQPGLTGDDDGHRRQRTSAAVLAVRHAVLAGRGDDALARLDAACTAAHGEAGPLLMLANLGSDLAASFQAAGHAGPATRAIQLGLQALRAAVAAGLPEPARFRDLPALAGLRQAPEFASVLSPRR